MKKTVVIYGHPLYEMSVSNKAIIGEFHKEVPEAEIVNLMELYPDYRIDVAHEQDRIKDADTIVFQFPFWWYSTPSILHRYVEEVFAHGFAYGSKGTALHGKNLILSFTAGAPEAAYTPEGAQGCGLDTFLPPFDAMANLCGLVMRSKIVSYGMMVVNPDDVEHNDAVVAEAKKHGRRLAAEVKGI